MQYYPAEALGDDATWERIRPFVAAGFAERDGAMLAAQWQACLDYDSSSLLPVIAVPIHAVAFSEDVQTPPRRVREVAELAANGHFHLLEGLGHGSAFGHRPEPVNELIARIIAGLDERRPSAEEREREREADVPDAGVDDLEDCRPPAAQDVALAARQPLLGLQPVDRTRTAIRAPSSGPGGGPSCRNARRSRRSRRAGRRS